MGKFTSKTVFVTGGSTGIGLATAEQLLRGGARVLLIARDVQKLERASTTLRNAVADADVDSLSLDVSNRAQCDELLPNAVSSFGKPDILINCAGFAIPEHFEKLTNEALADQWNVNLVGIWNTTQVLLRWIEEQHGTIVNVSSYCGFHGYFGYSAYSATKFAVVGLSEALRNELKHRGIRVQVFCPVDTETPGFERENLTKPEETRLMSEASAVLQPEQAARKLVRRINTNRFMIFTDFMSGLTRFVKGVSPGIAFAMTDSALRKAQRTIARRR